MFQQASRMGLLCSLLWSAGGAGVRAWTALSTYDQGALTATFPAGGLLLTEPVASPDFPTPSNAFDRTYNGGQSGAFMARLALEQFTPITDDPVVSDGGWSFGAMPKRMSTSQGGRCGCCGHRYQRPA